MDFKHLPEIFILELGAVNAPPACAIVVCEISTLQGWVYNKCASGGQGVEGAGGGGQRSHRKWTP